MFLVVAMNDGETVHRDVVFDTVEETVRILKERGEATGSDDGHGFVVFALDAFGNLADDTDIAPVDTRLHAGNRVRADHPLWPGHIDMGQRRGGLVEGFERKVHSRRDDSAHVSSVRRHHVEGRRGPEIDDDEVTAMPVEGAAGVHQPVGADARAGVDPGLDRQCAIGFAHDHGAGVEIAVAEHAEVEHHARHGGGDDDLVDRHVETLVLHESGKPDIILVRGALPLGRGPERREKATTVPYREDRVGVAAIDAEKHGGGALSQKKTSAAEMVRRPVDVSSTSRPASSTVSKTPVTVSLIVRAVMVSPSRAACSSQVSRICAKPKSAKRRSSVAKFTASRVRKSSSPGGVMPSERSETGTTARSGSGGGAETRLTPNPMASQST